MLRACSNLWLPSIRREQRFRSRYAGLIGAMRRRKRCLRAGFSCKKDPAIDRLRQSLTRARVTGQGIGIGAARKWILVPACGQERTQLRLDRRAEEACKFIKRESSKGLWSLALETGRELAAE